MLHRHATAVSRVAWFPAGMIQVVFAGQVYHPNIDLEGNVCLNILREDWKPVLSINSVLYGLQYLFLVSLCASMTRRDKGCFSVHTHKMKPKAIYP